jgi:hypothetical protein
LLSVPSIMLTQRGGGGDAILRSEAVKSRIV